MGPTTHYTCNWTQKIIHYRENEPYNAVDAISIRHDIYYRDNPADKHECDRKILRELNTLVPMGRRKKVDRQLVRSIIGLKHRLGLS